MKEINYGTGSIISCIFEVVVGILLLIDPVGFTSAVIVVFGIVLVVLGIFNVIRYFRMEPHVAAQDGALATGLIYTIFGLFCTFRSDWFISVFPVLTVLYGIIALISGVAKIQWAIDMLRTKRKYWYIEVINAALTIVIAILILANPFTSTSVLWTFIGITMIIEAAIDVVAIIMGKK